MRRHVIRQLLSIAAFGAFSALGMLGQAQAQVINFESLAPDFYTDGGSFTQSNFTLTQVGDFGVVDGPDSFFVAQAPTGNATQFYSGLNDSELALTLTDGGAFSLYGFDAGFVAPAPQLSGVIPGRMVLLGTQLGGNSISASWEFAASGDDGLFSFQHFGSGLGSFTNLTSLIFLACVYTDDGCQNPAQNLAQFSLDNVNVVAVPEPSTYVLLALGLCGVGVYSRRARR